MEIRRDRIRKKTRANAGGGIAKYKAATSMTNVELHPTLSCLEEILEKLSFFVHIRNGTTIHMGTDVSRPQFFGDKLVIGTVGQEIAKIDHDRNVSQRSGLNGTLDRNPIRTLVMGRLDAY